MKIAIFSDSHGNVDFMLKVLKIQSFDAVIHLGDHAADAQSIRLVHQSFPVYSVRGNCDLTAAESEEIILELEGKRILAIHGHTKNVKYGLLNALCAAREVNADILLFGHTHVPLCSHEHGVLLLNPGTIGKGNMKTYGIVEINNGAVKCCTVKVD